MKNLIVLVALMTLITFGCKLSDKEESGKGTVSESEKNETVKNEVVARVDGNPIYKGDLHGRPLESAITDQILYEEGLRQGLDKKYAKKVEDYKKNMIIGIVKSQILLKNAKNYKITQADIDEYVDQNRNKYRNLKLKKITAPDKNVAEEIQKRALEGQDFDKIASDYSNSNVEVTVTEIGPTNEYNDMFDEIAVGKLSGIRQYADRFQIFRIIEVSDKLSASQRRKITFELANRRKGETLTNAVEEIKKKDNIKVEIVGK